MERRRRENVVPGVAMDPAVRHAQHSMDETPATSVHVRPVAAALSSSSGEDAPVVHQLSERLTAAGNYLRGLLRLATEVRESPGLPTAEILARTLAQIDEAGLLIGRLRSPENRVLPAGNDIGPHGAADGADGSSVDDQTLPAFPAGSFPLR